MDDERTQDTLDALADLFLTQAERERSVASQTHAAIAPPPDDPLTGPSPIRLAPKAAGASSRDTPTTPGSPRAATGGRTPHAVPHLRYTGEGDNPAPGSSPESTDDDDPGTSPGVVASANHEPTPEAQPDTPAEPPPAAKPAEAFVEAVLLGNLPGLSGPWLTQYAQVLADQTGAVLLIHIDEQTGETSRNSSDDSSGGGGDSGGGGGQIELEVVEPSQPDQTRAAASVRVPPMRGSGQELMIGLIDSLVRARVGKVSTILIHMDSDADPRTCARLAALEDWTLITGTDDVSVAGAVSAVHRLHEGKCITPTTNLGLMMMGADEQAAHRAAGRIAEGTAQVLGERVQWLGSHQKMVPVNVRQLGTFRDLGALWPPLLAYLEDLVPPVSAEPAKPAQPQPKPQDAAPAPDAPPRTRDPMFQSILRPSTPAPGSTPAPDSTPAPERAPAAAASASGRGSERSTAERAAPSPATAPRQPRQAQTPQPEPQTPATEPPRLAELVATGPRGISGGIALEARCPHQPDTELLLDQAGVLHLLRRDTAPPDAAPPDAEGDELAGIRAAIVDLLEARKWVAEHLSLLQLTQRNARFADHAEPVLHLLTDKPHLATALVARLGDQLRLHLLQQIDTGPEPAWYCTPLS